MDALIQDKLVRNEIQASFPYLIEIWKESDTEKEECYRYVNADEDKDFTETVTTEVEGEPVTTTVTNTFAAAYFKISPPEKTDDGVKDATITISSIDQFWIGKIRDASERYKIRFVAAIDYEENNTEYIEPLDDITFTLTSAQWNEMTIQWTMKFDEWKDIVVPCQKLTQFSCPALF